MTELAPISSEHATSAALDSALTEEPVADADAAAGAGADGVARAGAKVEGDGVGAPLRLLAVGAELELLEFREGLADDGGRVGGVALSMAG